MVVPEVLQNVFLDAALHGFCITIRPKLSPLNVTSAFLVCQGDSYEETLTEWKGTTEWTYGIIVDATMLKHLLSIFTIIHSSDRK